MNSQRSVVYDRRNQALSGDDIDQEVDNILSDFIDSIVAENCKDENSSNPEEREFLFSVSLSSNMIHRPSPMSSVRKR